MIIVNTLYMFNIFLRALYDEWKKKNIKHIIREFQNTDYKDILNTSWDRKQINKNKKGHVQTTWNRMIMNLSTKSRI